MAEAAIAGGAALSAVGAIRQGDANANVAQYNADVATQNANLTLEQTAELQRRHDIQAKQQIGSMKASYGASGVTADGSAMDVLRSSAAKAELDSLAIKRQGDIRATAYQNESALDMFRSGNERTAGYLGAAAALVGGGGRIAGMESGGGGETD